MTVFFGSNATSLKRRAVFWSFLGLLVFSPFCALAAAPLQSGFAAAPSAGASAEERNRAFIEARRQILNVAMSYLGTPYRFAGMDRSGMDCSGFVVVSFRGALGVSIPRTSRAMYSWAQRIPIEAAQPGDLVFFRTGYSRAISHAGIYMGNGVFIHSASAGPQTGVIFSRLDERFWARTFAGAGRVLPEVTGSVQMLPAGAQGAYEPFSFAAQAGSAPSNSPVFGGSLPESAPPANDPLSSGNGRLLLGFAFAPTWNAFLRDGALVRGFASQIRLGAETYTFGARMLFGFELRPEYDGALGVFRLPFTFSWGLSDRLIFFAGPVVSFGSASLSTADGTRHYSGGTSWLGAVGVAAAPFSFRAAGGDLAPYMEVAWQSYFSDNSRSNFNADFSAGFRFSTGIRWMWQAN